MKLSLIREANITKTGTTGKVGKELGKTALGMAADLVPGGGLVATAGELTMKIVGLLKTKKDAKQLILKAMSLPDSDREELNIFDIDDNLWGPEGILNERSQAEIYQLVKTELDKLVAEEGNLPPNFANNIAIRYVKSKIGE